MSFRPALEIAAGSLASALAAQEGGADRVELCENLGEGGCTPSYGTLALARERLRIPLHVLIRPRGGDFVYGTDERDTMLRDIELCARLGCDGVVIGALDIDGDPDLPACRALVQAAGGMAVTFHRAFDLARDRRAALEDVIALGCQRVLTSGARADALAGAEEIAARVAQAAGRLRVMAGAGITPDNVAEVLRRSHADEVHASARTLYRSPLRDRRPGLPGLDADRQQTDPARVRRLREAMAR